MTSKRRKIYSRRPSLVKRANGIYYIHHQYSGRQVRLSTKTKVRCQADAALDRYLQDLANGLSPDAATMTVLQGIADWLEDRQSPRNGLQACTLLGYKTFAKKLLGVIPQGLLVRDLQRKHVRDALDRLIRAGESPIQVSKCQQTLSQVCNFLIIEGHVTHNPCVKVVPPVRYRTQTAMGESEYQAILKALELECAAKRGRGWRSMVNLRDMVEICWHTGFRYVEWTRIRWSDVDFDKRTVTTRSPKNKGGTRTRRLTSSAIGVLQRRRQLCGEVFPGTYAAIQSTWKRFRTRHPEFADARFHGMRRAFVTRMHEKLGPLAAMTLAGHSSSAMLDLYTDSNQVNWDKKMEKM
jgi:integrase